MTARIAPRTALDAAMMATDRAFCGLSLMTADGRRIDPKPFIAAARRRAEERSLG